MTLAAAPSRRMLVVEDEPGLADVIRRWFERSGHVVVIARDGIDALRCHRSHPVDVALIDLGLPGSDGLAVLRELRRDSRPPVCVIVTGHGTLDRAVEATRMGAADFVAKPFDFADLEQRISAVQARVAAAPASVAGGIAPVDDGIVALRGPSPAIAATVAQARLFADDHAPVIITGEIGTGQAELARYIHQRSPRAHGPLVEACCEQFTERGAAELFGADTRQRRPQRAIPLVALAAGGTLVLLGIEALDEEAQAALARELGRAPTVQAASPAPGEPCTRIIATMSTDLTTAVRAGTLNVSLARLLQDRVIVAPPLRARREDIPVLAMAFVREFGGVRPPVLAREASAALQAVEWGCNLSELRLVMERAVGVAEGGVIHAHDLTIEGKRPSADATLSLEELERRHIGAVLRRTNWHQGRAAELLGISAKTLYRKIREFGFRRPGSGA